MIEHENKRPPNVEKAEEALLGAALMDAVSVLDLLQRNAITADAFYKAQHGMIFNALVKMLEEGRSIDLHTAHLFLEQRGELEEIGGYLVLQDMVDNACTTAFAEYHARLVLEAWQKRQIIGAAREIIAEAEKTEKPSELILTAASKFAEITGAAEKKQDHAEIIQARINRWKEVRSIRRAIVDEKARNKAVIVDGLHTPWDPLTKILCGIQPALYIVAGRPSAGKTTVEEQLSAYQAQRGVGVLRFSMDITREQLLDRSVSRISGVSLPKMKQGFANDNQYARAEGAIADIKKWPMWIVDDCFRLETICARTRMMKLRHNIGLVTIDYLQLMRMSSGSAYINDNENARMTEIMAALKELWKSLNIPIIVTSQLNREVEKEERDPRMSDLRGSGSIEQDASAVIFLYKDAKKFKQMMEVNKALVRFKRPVWMVVMKNNQGETGSVATWMLPHYFRHDLAEPGTEDAFGDDGAPENLGRINDLFEDNPEYMPAFEGERSHPVEVQE